MKVLSILVSMRCCGRLFQSGVVCGKYECLLESVLVVVCKELIVILVLCTTCMCCLQVFLFIYIHKVICDFIHDCKSVCMSSCLEQVRVYLFFYVNGYSRCKHVIAYNKPDCPSVDLSRSPIQVYNTLVHTIVL